MKETTTAPAPCVDHLVVFAADLAGGVDWCQRTLGITPTAGGEHPLMGTHNRFFNISSPGHPRAYLEIIAINSVATSALPAGARRWFDMDDATLQQQVAQHGPQLIHWVASVPEVAASHAALAAQDIERGAIITASRPTPNGLLQWQITVREDGLRLMDGCLPTLIQWGAVHPCGSLPASGVQLQQLTLQHPQAATLRAACEAIGVAPHVAITAGDTPQLAAQLTTPRGPVTLSSFTPPESCRMNARIDPSPLLPTLADIEAAAQVVYRDFAATPQYRWGLLSQRLGTDCWLKHENHTPVGAFKIRGGLTYFDQLAQRGRLPQEVISATRGNHGQSMGWAARRHGVACTIVVPRGNSIEKNAAMRALGVTLIEHGDDFQEAREHAMHLAQQRGAHMVPSFHPDLLRGVSTYWWEFLRAVPQLDVVYVPIGQGSGACSAIAAKLALQHPVRVVGVVSSHATTYADSLAAGSVVEAPVTTQLADGMACRVADPEALAVLAPHIDHIVQVSDAEVAAAMRALFTDTHNVAEGAGAAALAAALQERELLQDKTVGLALTGGNVDASVFAQTLRTGH